MSGKKVVFMDQMFEGKEQEKSLISSALESISKVNEAKGVFSDDSHDETELIFKRNIAFVVLMFRNVK